uniref:Uncharacterized protein n=1 Tax=Ditylenchus dipsaci TaxID=166011 RepID=A0A915ESN3_9BILA
MVSTRKQCAQQLKPDLPEKRQCAANKRWYKQQAKNQIAATAAERAKAAGKIRLVKINTCSLSLFSCESVASISQLLNKRQQPLLICEYSRKNGAYFDDYSYRCAVLILLHKVCCSSSWW